MGFRKLVLILFLIFLTVGSASAAISLVQDTNTTGAPYGTGNEITANVQQEGNLLALFTQSYDATGADTGPITISDTAGNTWYPATDRYHSTYLEHKTGQWFYCYANSTGSNTITATYAAGTPQNITMRVDELSGVKTSDPVDLQSSFSGAASACPTISTNYDNEIILYGYNVYLGENCLAATESGFAWAGGGIPAKDDGSVGYFAPVQYLITSSSVTDLNTTITPDGYCYAGWGVSFIAADEEPPGATFNTYIVSPFNDTKILPNYTISDSFLGSNLSANLSKGERSSSSFVVNSSTAVPSLTAVCSNFTDGTNTLSSNVAMVRTVKCWYQAGYDDHNYVRADYWNHSLDAHYLTPELLLNNSSIITVDEDDWTQYNVTNPSGKNYLHLKDGSTVDITLEENQNIDNADIHDASSLQPLNLSANYNQQYYITWNIPDDSEAGTYTGTITLQNGTETFETLNVTLKVLPFELDANPMENSIYFQPSISAYGITTYYAPEDNYRVYLQNMLDHGITNPMFWPPENNETLTEGDNATLVSELQIRQELGINNSNMYYHGILPNEDYQAYYDMFSPYGVDEIYLYGPDEQEINVTQVEAEHAAGYKHFNAQSLYVQEHPDVLDLVIEYGGMAVEPPDPAIAATYHEYGHRIYSYGNPQTVPEWPRTWRWHYGLMLWAANYDGSCPFAYMSYVGDAWNDFCDVNWYERQSCIVYPYDTGVVDTVQYEGLAEASNDVRYVTTLQNTIDDHADPSDQNVTEAQNYLDTLYTENLSNTDFDEMKTTLQDHIVTLETYNSSVDVSSYVVPAISDTLRILPGSEINPSYSGSNLSVNASKGEITDRSFVLNSNIALSNVNLTVSNFTNGSNTLPASAIDIKYVVPWYYGTTDNFDEHITGRFLQPDLLVYDRSLIIANETQGEQPTNWTTDNQYGKNYIKLQTGAYQDISTDADNGYDGALASNRPIYDADILQATTLEEGKNQQYMITLRVPNTTASGIYNGTITATDGTNIYKTLNMSIRVLPFELNESAIEYGLYYHSFLDPQNRATIGWQNKSEAQLTAEFEDLADHGVTHPILNPGNWADDQDPNGINDSAVIRTIELRQDAGINDSNLYYWSNAKYDNATILYYRDLFAPYTDQLYIYGKDETAVNRSVLAYEHSIGVKHFNAQSITLAWADDDILDYCVCLNIDNDTAAGFHENGNRIANYHQPQSAINYPELFRKNAGVALWQNNYDGWFDFAYQWHNNADLWQTTYSYDNLVPYVFAYPTANGVVDTLRWEGVREAWIDTKYITTLQNKINENTSDATAIEAQDYLDTLKNASVTTLDMDTERATMQDYLTELNTEEAPAPAEDIEIVKDTNTTSAANGVGNIITTTVEDEGHLLAVFTQSFGTDDTGPISISDTAGNTYYAATDRYVSTYLEHFTGQWFYCYANAAGENTITATYSGNTPSQITMRVIEISGITGDNPIDVRSNFSGDLASCPTISTNYDNEIILYGYHKYLGIGNEPATGFSWVGGSVPAQGDGSSYAPVQYMITDSTQINLATAPTVSEGYILAGWGVSFYSDATPPPEISISKRLYEWINALINRLINNRLHLGDVILWQI